MQKPVKDKKKFSTVLRAPKLVDWPAAHAEKGGMLGDYREVQAMLLIDLIGQGKMLGFCLFVICLFGDKVSLCTSGRLGIHRHPLLLHPKCRASRKMPPYSARWISLTTLHQKQNKGAKIPTLPTTKGRRNSPKCLSWLEATFSLSSPLEEEKTLVKLSETSQC